ncbi:MAG: type III deoxyribonuclease, partial [Rikenellaceae bacterium]
PTQIEEVILPADLEPIKEMVVEMVQESKPIEVATLSGSTYTETEVVEKTMSYDDAKEVITHLEKKGYIDKKGKVKDTMKNALLDGKIDLPEKFKAAQERFESVIKKSTAKPPLRDASRDVTVRINKQVMLSPEFMELWNKIKQKTSYRVEVDTDALVVNSVKDIAAMERIHKARIISQSADINIERAGVSYREVDYHTEDLKEAYTSLPNLVGIVSEKCLITRRTAAQILEESGRIKEFLNNPQLFIERVIDVINHHRHALAIDGIRYIKLDGEEYSVMEIFAQEELLANLDRNAVEVKHSVYDYVIYDSSTIEKPFAVALDNDPNVKMFFKIPSRFKIDTPIGTYNPDWAVYIEQDGIKKLYFVLETKGTNLLFDLRTPERLKIHCGEQHFKALEEDVSLHTTKSWEKFKVEI